MAEGPWVVTGAGGYVGRRLCRRLRGAGAVRAVVRRPPGGPAEAAPWDDAIAVDLARDAPPVGVLEGAAAVFHLAALTHADARSADEARYRAVNVEGTRRVLEACRAAGIRRFVFFSSVKAIGEHGDGSRGPTTPYGRTKREAERLVLDGGFVPEPVVLRPAMVYGPGAPGNFSRMVAGIRAGWFPPPPRGGGRRSMVHVDDVVEAALLCATHPDAPGRVFTVTDGEAYTARELYDWTRRALGRPPRWWGPPAAVWRAAGRLGDVVGTLAGRRVPFDSAACARLLGGAVYTDDAIRAVGFRPSRRLPDALPGLVRPPDAAG